ncbi:hypothetical protein [Celeribacter sp.]|uniref:hypothetical protein n=1 Tax=Celeribacter sp. TaxID=1890673 RepID=UPI003A901AF3
MLEVIGVLCCAAVSVLCWSDYRAARGGWWAAVVFGGGAALWGLRLLLEALA